MSKSELNESIKKEIIDLVNFSMKNPDLKVSVEFSHSPTPTISVVSHGQPDLFLKIISCPRDESELVAFHEAVKCVISEIQELGR